jgi:hypothetical protein
VIAMSEVLSPPSKHPISADAVLRAYRRLCWVVAVIAGLIVVAATDHFVPKSQQRVLLTWIEDWLTNLPSHIAAVGNQLRPATGGFYLLLLFVTALLVQFVIKLTPLKTWLLRYSEYLVAPGLGRLLPQVMEQYEFSPAEPDQIFVERDTILAELLRLSADERPYGVIVVSGPNGIGKTRLAIEWLAALRQARRRLLRSRGSQWQRLCHPAHWRDRPWDAGFLDAEAIADLRRKNLSNWQPLQPTAVVLDATNLPLEEWRGHRQLGPGLAG